MKEPFNISDLFFDRINHAQKLNFNIEKDAIVFEKKRITFSELSTQVTATAGYLQSKGIQKGDRLLILIPMSIDLYRTVLALFKLGAVAVFMDEWVNRKRLNLCCEIADCKAFIANRKIFFLSHFFEGLRNIPLKLTTYYKKKNFSEVTTFSDELALITFTTGSTGVPKAAKRTHLLLKEQFDALHPLLQPQPNEVSMPMLPIVLLFNLGAGITSVIMKHNIKRPELFRTEEVIQTWKREGVSQFISSPHHLLAVANWVLKNGSPEYYPKSFFTGGGPVFPANNKLLKEAFPNASITVVYGSTEAEPISSYSLNDSVPNNEVVEREGLYVGKIESSTQVKIIEMTDVSIICEKEKELKEMEKKDGEPGEIIVSGNHVLKSYWRNKRADLRHKIIVENVCWHRTGDCGYKIEDELYLLGRCQDIIYQDNTLLSPFIFEGFCEGINGISKGTILFVNDNLTVAIEPDPVFQRNFSEIENQLLKHFKFNFKVVSLKRIPRDPRHHTKIDYAALKRKISRI